MAYKQQRTTYEFSPEAKVSMVMILDQFPESMTTIHEIKNQIMVDGSFLLDTYEAVLLARLIAPYYPAWAEKLMAPLENYPAMTPNEWQGRFFELVNRF